MAGDQPACRRSMPGRAGVRRPLWRAAVGWSDSRYEAPNSCGLGCCRCRPPARPPPPPPPQPRSLQPQVGCPIHEASRRGLGAIMLRKPRKLARLVEGMASALPIPLTVKIRIGENASRVNVHEVAELLEGAGAAAVFIHGRTMEVRGGVGGVGGWGWGWDPAPLLVQGAYIRSWAVQPMLPAVMLQPASQPASQPCDSLALHTRPAPACRRAGGTLSRPPPPLLPAPPPCPSRPATRSQRTGTSWGPWPPPGRCPSWVRLICCKLVCNTSLVKAYSVAFLVLRALQAMICCVYALQAMATC